MKVKNTKGHFVGTNLSAGEQAEMQRLALNLQHQAWGSCCQHTKKALKYISELFALRSAPDILSLGLFPEVKEITESFAAFNAVRNYLDFDLKDPEVSLVAVGDGHTPRTAATFAFRSNWRCYSVDPVLRSDKNWDIARLSVHPYVVEDFSLETNKAVIVAVHSHADLNQAVKSIKARELAIVAIPCCKDQILNDQIHDLQYADEGILSPARLVYVWKRVLQYNLF